MNNYFVVIRMKNFSLKRNVLSNFNVVIQLTNDS